jgi:hypothetical protein
MFPLDAVLWFVYSSLAVVSTAMEGELWRIAFVPAFHHRVTSL